MCHAAPVKVTPTMSELIGNGPVGSTTGFNGTVLMRSYAAMPIVSAVIEGSVGDPGHAL